MDHEQQNDLWADLNPLRFPPPFEGSYTLDAGGFVFGERFDTLLRLLSEDYLRTAWERLVATLQRHAFDVEDLSWGWLHGGVTSLTSPTQWAPSDYTGWTSLALYDFEKYTVFSKLDEELQAGSPILRCACSYRTAKWRIAPHDVSQGLKLIEALWTDDPTDWSPGGVLLDHERLLALNRQSSKALLEGNRAEADRLSAEETAAYETTSPAYFLTDAQGINEPWRRIAGALLTRDRLQLRDALAEARCVYSLVGYRLLVCGYTCHLTNTVDGASMLPLI